MKFVVDAFGADKGESVVVEGCVRALNSNKDVELILVGDLDVINPMLDGYKYDKNRLELVDAKDKITNNDVPTLAIKTKKESSMVKAFDICKQNEEVSGIISCGSTGALLTGGVLKIGRIPGVLRPALSPLVPSDNGYFTICDCGANMDCKPEYLAQFAVMASCMMQAVADVPSPSVGLVSVGDEDKKGNDLTHAAFELIKKLPVNFVGNVESRDALSGKYNVLVTDGFVGNVMMKAIEGTAMFVVKALKKEIKSSKSAMFGALFMKKAFFRLKNKMDYNKAGGACFIGVKKLLVKSHGSSNAEAVASSINLACKLHEKKVIDNITGIMQTLKSEAAE